MIDHLSTTAMTRVQRARSEFIMAHRFYGVLVSNVEPVITREHETAATNGRQHFWNPDFIATLSQEQLLFVQAHESEHDARHHSTRRGNRDPELWNRAADYGINIDLVDAGFVPAPNILLDAKYRGMSAEEIYRCLELEKPQQPQQPEEGGDEADEDEQSKSDGDEGDEGQSGSDADEANDADEADEDGGDSGAEDDADADADEGEGKGEGNGADADGEADDRGTGKGAGADGEPGRGSEPVVGDVGGCGEVLDASDEPNDLSEQDAKWETITRQAASLAKAAGQLPGHVTREIERSNNPTQDWRETLRAYFDQGALRTETWNRPNRRHIGRGLILPGSQRDGVNKVCFLIDTSYSIYADPVALQLVRDEAQAALDDGVVEEAVVIYGDTRVTRVDTYRTGDEIEFDPRGGGGTSMEPLFRYVADEHDDASLIVNFTDLEFSHPGDEPHCPVLFAVTGMPQRASELIANAPWGAPCIDVGAH